jgi:hypothetical protein
MRDPLSEAARAVLNRHPAPALPAEELCTLLARERPGAVPWGVDELLNALERADEGPRVIRGSSERLGQVTARRWVVAPAGHRAGGFPSRSLSGKMRESLRTLGESLEPGSHLALARWVRLLMEEERARRLLERRKPKSRGGPSKRIGPGHAGVPVRGPQEP